MTIVQPPKLKSENFIFSSSTGLLVITEKFAILEITRNEARQKEKTHFPLWKRSLQNMDYSAAFFQEWRKQQFKPTPLFSPVKIPIKN
jgi:hypothetical protein